MKKTILRRSALSGAILMSLGSAQGATILVGDGFSGCTLQDAIVAANTDAVVNSCTAGSGADTIQLGVANIEININTAFEPSNVNGDVGLPIISSVVTIEGNGLTISANNEVNNFRVFEIDFGADLTLRDTTVTGADDGIGLGSGLFSENGRITLENTTFQNNNGAIFLAYSQSNVINNSVINNNTISIPYYAAGIQTFGAELTITHSSITNNKFEPGVGPIPRRGPGVIPTGIFLPSGGGLTFFQSQVSVTNSTISGNSGYYGAGLAVFGSAIKSANLWRSGQIKAVGDYVTDITLINNTITNNQAIAIGGILDLADVGTLTLQGNIISGNSDALTNIDNLYSSGNTTINLDGNNIIGDNGQTKADGVTLGASDMTFSDATSDNLYPLIASNGQLVHPLKPGSVAIDAMPLSCFGLITDQEGKGRGIDGNNDGTFVCDIGALENAKPIVVNDAPCDLVNAVNSANSDGSVGGCQPGNGHDIIVLEENSLHSLDTVSYVLRPNYGGYNFGLPAVTSGITLAGNGSTIEKADSLVEQMDIVVVPVGGDLTLTDVTLTKSDSVAAVLTQGGDVTLLNATITGNQAIGLAAVTNSRSAVYNSTISNNNNLGSVFDSSGGGILVSNSSNFKIKNSTLTGNVTSRGAGLLIASGTDVEVLNSTISGNTATNVGSYYGFGAGGGAYVTGSDGVTLTGLTVTGNAANDLAGGMVIQGSNAEPLISLNRSIFSGNMVTPPATIHDSNRGNAYSEPSRLLFPKGRPNSQQLNASNRGILVDEVAVIGDPAILTVDANNIFGQNNSSGTAGFTVGASDVIPVGSTSTVIEPSLTDNGGNTLTHNLVASGPAVDYAGGCLEETDQVGNFRNWNANTNSFEIGSCDVGAVEFNSIPVNDIIFKDGFNDGNIMN